MYQQIFRNHTGVPEGKLDPSFKNRYRESRFSTKGIDPTEKIFGRSAKQVTRGCHDLACFSDRVYVVDWGQNANQLTYRVYVGEEVCILSDSALKSNRPVNQPSTNHHIHINNKSVH